MQLDIINVVLFTNWFTSELSWKQL